MQVLFLVLYGVSLVTFSVLVSRLVHGASYLIEGERVPFEEGLEVVVWLGLFLLSFLGTGFYLYEREREEGRIARRIGVYEWVLNKRHCLGETKPSPLRRPADEANRWEHTTTAPSKKKTP